MNKRATLSEVARRAGVGKATASRAFTEGASVSVRTRDKVVRAANELNYYPSRLAKSLSTGRTRYIGLAFAYLDNPFYAEAVEKLTYRLQSEGYQVLLLMAWNDTPEEKEIVQQLLDYQVEGIITGSASISSAIAARCSDSSIPIVMFNRDLLHQDLPAVTSDNYRGACAATELLIRTGHTRIAHIAGWQQATTGIDRVRGFRDTMERAGLEPIGVIDAHFLKPLAEEATHELMKAPTRPDAIFVGNDNMAVTVMDALRSTYGVDVPNEVSIVGYDDTIFARLHGYQLTTIRQPVNRMVDQAVDLMQELILHPHQKPPKKIVPASLVVGETVRGTGPTKLEPVKKVAELVGVEFTVCHLNEFEPIRKQSGAIRLKRI
ncbi:MAG: LacI family transcriptional regulator [Boseongicola sp. SB0670_bin_30]|nr:LacI family transcriptional regulator [Boseongicola sp. SB0670_bin_30]